MKSQKPIVSKVNKMDDFDISALASIIQNCEVFLNSDLRKNWNECYTMLKESRNELHHSVTQKSSPMKRKNFEDLVNHFIITLKELVDDLRPENEIKRYFNRYVVFGHF